MSKQEKRTQLGSADEYYQKWVARGWYFADYDFDADQCIMRVMTENGYGDITAQQARLMSYRDINDLSERELEQLAGIR